MTPRKNAITEVRITREPDPVTVHLFGCWVLGEARAAGLDVRGLAPHPLPGQPMHERDDREVPA